MIGGTEMKNKILLSFVLMFAFIFCGCNTDEDIQAQYDLGYDDGWAAGYESGQSYGYNKAMNEMQVSADEETEDKTDEESSETVYVTNYGECYHKEWCGSLWKSKIPISLEEAEKNYSPCSKCF